MKNRRSSDNGMKKENVKKKRIENVKAKMLVTVCVLSQLFQSRVVVGTIDCTIESINSFYYRYLLRTIDSIGKLSQRTTESMIYQLTAERFSFLSCSMTIITH